MVLLKLYHCGIRTASTSLSLVFSSPPISPLHWGGSAHGMQAPPSWPGQCVFFCVHLTCSFSSSCSFLLLMFFLRLLKHSKCLRVWSWDLSLCKFSPADLSQNQPRARVHMTSGSRCYLARVLSPDLFQHPTPCPILSFFYHHRFFYFPYHMLFLICIFLVNLLKFLHFPQNTQDASLIYSLVHAGAQDNAWLELGTLKIYGAVLFSALTYFENK